jgi:hypothetical protein
MKTNILLYTICLLQTWLLYTTEKPTINGFIYINPQEDTAVHVVECNEFLNSIGIQSNPQDPMIEVQVFIIDNSGVRIDWVKQVPQIIETFESQQDSTFEEIKKMTFPHHIPIKYIWGLQNDVRVPLMKVHGYTVQLTCKDYPGRTIFHDHCNKCMENFVKNTIMDDQKKLYIKNLIENLTRPDQYKQKMLLYLDAIQK